MNFPPSFSLLRKGVTDTTALAAPVPAASLPSAVLPCKRMDSVRLVFGGSDGANEIVNYQVVLWFATKDPTGGAAYWPLLVASGAATLGALTYTVDGVGATSRLVADTITNTSSHQGVSVYSPANDSMAYLDISTEGADAVEIEIDLDTAASADVFAAALPSLAQPTSQGQATANTALAAILAKIIAAPATEATLAGVLDALAVQTLAITTITVTASSATIQALLTTASGSIHADVKQITLRPVSDVYCALGAAAQVGTNILEGGVRHVFVGGPSLDLRLIHSVGSIACVVIQEG